MRRPINREDSMLRRVAIAAMLLPGIAAAQSVSPTIEKQILAARDTVWRAWFANDTAALRRLLPPAATAAEGSGATRWTDRTAILQGSQRAAASGSRLERIDFANTRISLTGDVAVVTSNYRLVMHTAKGADTSRGRATEVFVRDGNHWVNPFWHLASASAAGSREIPLPDTLGADFSIADTNTVVGSAADYDTLVGFWEFRFQTRGPNGAFGPSFTGHWSFEKKPGGMLIEDHWRGDDPSSPMGVSTYTYRVFDPERKIWRMLGTNARGGEFALGLTWSDSRNRYAIQHYGDAIMRIRYFALEPNHFLWRADRTTDGGRTWQRDAWTMEAWRIGK
jgi:ketosteroid isomerase-like protein